MIDRSFIEKIEELTKARVFTVDGNPYTAAQLHPVVPPGPAALKVHTLTAMADYLKANVDGLGYKELLVHVEAPEMVRLLGKIDEPFYKRHEYLSASPPLRKSSLNEYRQVEQFIIMLQILFVQTEATAQIIKVVGNLADEKVTHFNDDGVTQKVTARVGITKVADVQVPSPILLSPFRTFLEVEQPESKFILRIKGREGAQPECALIEADGGAWEIEAVKRVKDWLNKNLPAGTAIIS